LWPAPRWRFGEPINGTESGTGGYRRGRMTAGAPTLSAWYLAKGSAMATLISVLITFVVIILVLYLVNMLPIEGRAKHIVRIIVVIIGILSLLKYLTVF
jgi:hypothetical protein